MWCWLTGSPLTRLTSYTASQSCSPFTPAMLTRMSGSPSVSTHSYITTFVNNNTILVLGILINCNHKSFTRISRTLLSFPPLHSSTECYLPGGLPLVRAPHVQLAAPQPRLGVLGPQRGDRRRDGLRREVAQPHAAAARQHEVGQRAREAARAPGEQHDLHSGVSTWRCPAPAPAPCSPPGPGSCCTCHLSPITYCCPALTAPLSCRNWFCVPTVRLLRTGRNSAWPRL